MLKIAMLGACPVQRSEFAVALKGVTQAVDCEIMLLAADQIDALTADLPGFYLVFLAGIEAPELPKPPGMPFLAPCKMVPYPVSAQEAIDHSIRAALARAGVSYRVLYGTTSERLAHVLQAVESLQPPARKPRRVANPGGLKNQPWVWMCEKCSDPQCEHRLLTALLAQRDSKTATPGEQARLLLNR